MSKEDLLSIEDLIDENLPSVEDFIEEGKDDLPSLDSLVENNILPSIKDIPDNEDLPSVEDFTEILSEETVSIEDAEGNTFAEIEDIIPPWPELLKIINDVRDQIPDIPEIKYYDAELEKLCEIVDEIRNEIPEVKYYDTEVEAICEQIDLVRNTISELPEVKYYDEYIDDIQNRINIVKEDIENLPEPKYYDEDLQSIREDIEIVKKNFPWIEANFKGVEESLDNVNDSIGTVEEKISLELDSILETVDVKVFENKVLINEVKDNFAEDKQQILAEIKESSQKIFDLHNEFKDDDRKLKKQIQGEYNKLKKSIQEQLEKYNQESVKTDELLLKYFTELKEEISKAPKVKYYDDDIITLQESIKKSNKRFLPIESDIKSIYKIVEDIKKTQIKLNEQIINEPSEVNQDIGAGKDPLTPIDQKFATLDDLSKHYQLFVTRIQQQLSTIGGGGAGYIKDLSDVDISGLADGYILQYNASENKWETVVNSGAGSASLDEVLSVGNTSSNGMSVGVVTATSFDGDGSGLTGIATNIIAGDNITVSQDGGSFTINSTSSGIAVTDGMSIGLGTPTDSDLVTPGALNTFTTETKVTDSIDDLNELMFNVIRNTAVTEVDFEGFPLAGGSPLGIALTITHSGNANRYDIDWGDGSSDTASSLATVSHTYTQSSGGTNTVTVTAYNNNGVGAGHSFTVIKSNYVVVYTPDPGIAFEMFAAVSGGSSISLWDSGTPVYLENSTSNVTGFAVTYSLDWGDGDIITINQNSDPGGVGGGRTVHTYNNSSEQDTEYTVDLELSSHPAANPGVIPVNGTQTFRVYSTHTPSFSNTPLIGINSSSNSGFPVIFTNTTEDTIGSFTTFGNTYRWTWGDGSTDNVNVGSGSAGDNDVDISHTFALTDEQQSVGTSRTFAVNLRAITNHTSSPFITDNVVVTVEPETRSIFTGVATVISDRTGDNSQDLYDGVDIFGRNRRVGIFTNTSQNADDYVFAWGDGSSNDTIANNEAIGGTSTPINHTFQGSTGNKIVTLTANGTPGTLVQNGRQSTVTMQLNAVPSAPTSLSASTLTLSTGSEGTSPLLCANATDNTSGSGIPSGSSVTRYATASTIQTNNLNDINGSHTGILTALYNGSADGQKTFTTSTGETGTFTSLVITSEGDAHDEISSSTYPTGFFQCFTARISKALSGIDTGVNDFGMTHSTGSCGLVTFVKDNLNSTPSVTAGTLSEGTGGTKKYISGIPYYNTGSPSLNLTGVEVTNFMGQTYRNITSPVEVDPGTNQESTSGNVIGNNDYNYSDIDGDTTFLSGGIPIANTGVGVAYTFGTLAVPITSSSVRSVQTIKVRAKNPRGNGSYTTNSTKIQVHTASQSGINETAIAVSDSLGSNFDDDGVRVFDFSSATANTPSFDGSTNFYTNNTYSESSDPGVSGTKEATVRLGVLKHDTTDYSSGFLPVGPDRSSDTGTQFFTFAFRRQVVANFDINITSSGISGLWIAAPGTDIDDASGLNGWLRADQTFGGSGTPGSDTANGGNGSDGCAFTSGDRIAASTSLSGGYTMTLGDQNMSDATGNVVLVRIALASGQSVTALSIGVAA